MVHTSPRERQRHTAALRRPRGLPELPICVHLDESVTWAPVGRRTEGLTVEVRFA